MPVAEGRRHKAHRPGLLAENLAGGRQGALLHHVLGVKVHLAAVLGHHLIWLDSALMSSSSGHFILMSAGTTHNTSYDWVMGGPVSYQGSVTQLRT